MKHFFKKYFANRYIGIYKHAKTLFVFDIILLISAIFLLSTGIFLFFWTPSISDQIEINFSYSSQKIISGQDLEIYVSFVNNSKFEMKDTVLALHFPLGFSLDKAKNTFVSEKNTVNFGGIPPGGNGNLSIFGQIIGNTTEKDKILAILTYKIGNTNKIDQKNELGFIKYSGSEMKSELFIEKTTFPDKTLPFSIKITNISEKNIDNIGIILPNFAKISTNTPISLSPNQKMTINGIFEIPKTIGKIPFTVQITRRQNSKEFIQEEQTAQIDVLSPDIGLKITPQITDAYLESGGNLTLDVIFENLSGNILQNQTLILQDTSGVIDLPFVATENNIKENGQELIIDKTTRDVFENGSKTKSDRFTLNLKLKKDAGALAPNLKIIPIFSAKLFGSETNFSHTGNELIIPITSLLQGTAYARYYTTSGDQLGRGPLPPQIGQATKYWIYTDIKNGANNLNDFKLTAKPSENVVLTGKQSVSYGNEIIFNANIATWQKELFSSFTTAGFYFEVETTPTAKNLNKELELIKEIKIEATDSLTKKKYLLELGPVINKLLPEDVGSKLDNKVVE